MSDSSIPPPSPIHLRVCHMCPNAVTIAFNKPNIANDSQKINDFKVRCFRVNSQDQRYHTEKISHTRKFTFSTLVADEQYRIQVWSISFHNVESTHPAVISFRTPRSTAYKPMSPTNLVVVGHNPALRDGSTRDHMLITWNSPKTFLGKVIICIFYVCTEIQVCTNAYVFR